jgi:hypothetical protein
MDKKPQKSWADVQLTIAALAITVTLTLWNIFATPAKQQVSVQPTEPVTPPEPLPTEVAQATAPQFVPVKIIFGGTAPQQQVVVQAASAQPAHKAKGGGGAPPAPPHGGTGSSKP